ncbi:MAG: ABC transporter ATP-binding protein [Propionibacteriaceae bacterium]|nr:ABC transporter ATP-binding protein [Propionibacteriaceae bacterium]
MIDLVGIEKVYRGRNFEVTALRSVDLTIPRGQFVSVVGRSGSGKSSLMKILGLLDFDYRGEYLLDSTAYRGAGDARISTARRRVGYVFQDFQLIPRYTVARNLELAGAIRAGTHDPALALACLADVGLADKATSYPDELSGGQQQRVAIARAVLARPDLIIADEPTGALDATTAQDIVALLRRVHSDLGCAVVLVTHDQEIAAAADRTVELVDGRVHRDLLR